MVTNAAAQSINPALREAIVAMDHGLDTPQDRDVFSAWCAGLPKGARRQWDAMTDAYAQAGVTWKGLGRP